MPDSRINRKKTVARRPIPQQQYGPSLSRFKDRMGHRLKIVFGILLALIAVSSVAFFAGAPYGDVGGGPSQPSGDTVVIKVGKANITRSQLDAAVSQVSDSRTMYGGGPISITDQPMIYAQAVNGLVQQQVELRAAQHSKSKVTSAEYNKLLNSIVDQRIKQEAASYVSQQAFEQFLKNSGTTMADERSKFRSELSDMAQQQGLDLRTELTNQLLVQNFKRDYEMKQDLGQFLRYSQIVISTAPAPAAGGQAAPPAANPQADAKAKSLAASLMQQLKSGADFAKLAKTYSSDSASKSKGGDAGWASPGSQYAPDYMKGATNAKVGDLIGPVKSYDGYHIIKITGETHRLPAGLDNASNADKQLALPLQQAADDLYQKYLTDLTKRAKVEYMDPLVRAVVAQSKGDTKAAALQYEQALSSKQRLPASQIGWAAYAAGQLMLAQNQTVKAADYFDRATKADPTSANAWLAAGDAQKKLSHKDIASQDYKQALAMAGMNPDVLMQLESRFADLKDTASVKAVKAQMLKAQQSGQGMGGMFNGMQMPAGLPPGSIKVNTPPAPSKK